jgi:crotonobetainyl-CoA:carnitine CoA-transferase CaiB-like acyl-CoA transferase
MSEDTPASGPLEGVRVLDASRVLAGPFCGMQLGDLGADVIKVERPDGGDQTRHWVPPTFGDSDLSSYYASINRNKRSITLDLSSERGREIYRDLASEADVVLENFRVGKPESWNIDYETLKTGNPDLVYCSITGYGETGPGKHRPAYDLVLQAEAGIMSITGETGRPPVRVGIAMVDLATGMYATQAILGALFQREFNDVRGEKIDVSLFDSVVAWLSYMATNTFASGESPIRLGSRHPNIAPYQAFEAKDDHVVVAAASQGIWYRFCEALDLPDLVEDPRFETNLDRVNNRAALEEELQAVIGTYLASALVERLRDFDVPATEIHDIEEVFELDVVAARDMKQSIEHPGAGVIEMPGCPMNYDSFETHPKRHPPSLGEHTEELLRELGYQPEEISAFFEENVV